MNLKQCEVNARDDRSVGHTNSHKKEMAGERWAFFKDSPVKNHKDSPDKIKDGTTRPS